MKMLDTGFSPWPVYQPEDIEAVARVLASGRVNYWTGSECRAFEREFAASVDTRHAVALANGTVALELALRVLRVGAGDEVVVTPRTFLASASCIVAVGARPVFADVDPDSQNITADTVRRVLSKHTRAIICVHLAGWPCDMDPLIELAGDAGIHVVEDCAQANGAKYRGRSVGGIGHVSAWSFCQDKIITTAGEGGMLTTSDPVLWGEAWAYKDHGKNWDAVYRREHAAGFRWVHESFGTNWRMTEMQAVIGRLQLARLPVWNAARLANARRIWSTASRLAGLRVPHLPDDIVHAAYRCYVFVEPRQLRAGWDRNRILAEINQRGVPCFQGSCPEIYLEKAFDGAGLRPVERLPVARQLGETSLSFLVHPTLTPDEIDRTCGVLTEVMSAAT